MATLGALWLCAVGWGMKHLADYEFAPGAAGAPPERLRAESLAGRDEPFQLFVGLHPECPCSAATVEVLDRLVAERSGRLVVHAWFLDAGPSSPQQSALWKRVSGIPGATISEREGACGLGEQAFKTSGEVCLYTPTGELVFHGGVTIGRGHPGNSPGRQAILAALDGSAEGVPDALASRAPVFGCGLADETAEGSR